MREKRANIRNSEGEDDDDDDHKATENEADIRHQGL
jgi:hypothetical protein